MWSTWGPSSVSRCRACWIAHSWLRFHPGPDQQRRGAAHPPPTPPSILMGLDDMDEVLDRRDVRFVIVRARTPDIPEPGRSRQVMNAHPRMRLVFRNADVFIYDEVRPGLRACVVSACPRRRPLPRR
ncbi:MAG: hypothetical protein IPK19_29100 [Chloroflexi bacterium]|nr:hypothetical protein [Chloroflexota bacterium]